MVANMIGTGVFTSLGLQLSHLSDGWTILLLWLLGGIFALLGALSYAELGTRLPRSGGEYHFIQRIYGPFWGYLAGWVSLTVGFSASVALAALALGAYLEPVTGIPQQPMAMGAIIGISLLHSVSIKQSSVFQNTATLIKLGLLALFIGACFSSPGASDSALKAPLSSISPWSPAFMVGLVYVAYAFSGWNAAAYIVEEIRAPQRSLPKALLAGTIAVSLLYVLLQAGFLYQVSPEALRGRIDIGQLVGAEVFGTAGSKAIAVCIALFLVSSISASIWVGPRVVRAMADDFRIWGFLARDNARGIPVRAVWLQGAISLFMVTASHFDEVFLYSGFVLQLFTTLAVAGVILLRLRHGPPSGYRSPGYPWVQLAFLALSVWMLGVLLYDQPRESLMGLANLGVGAVSYFWSRRFRGSSG